MADYLTDKTVFQCSLNKQVRIGASDPACKVSYKGNTVLTSGATLFLKTPGTPCPALSPPGSAPLPCAFPGCSASTAFKGLDGTHQGNSKPLLTDSFSCPCPTGVSMGAQISVLSHNTQNRFFQGKASSDSSSSGKSRDEEKSNQQNSKPGESREKDEKESKAKPAESSAPQKNLAVNSADPAKNDKNLNTKKDEPAKDRDAAESQVLRCRDCKEKERCKTRKRISGMDFYNKSSLLRSNYKKRVDNKPEELPFWIDETVQTLPPHPKVHAGHAAHEAYNSAEARRKSWCGQHPEQKGWIYAAHHLICGNEVVRPLEDLLALVKAFDYRINGADNCIMLPGKSSDVSFKGMEDSQKYINKFEVMSQSRMQWHGGRHGPQGGEKMAFSDRTIPMPKDYFDRIKDGMRTRHYEHKGEPRYYAQLLRERCKEIVKKYRRNPICPHKDFEIRADKFYREMNELADEIRLALTRFAEKPHRSFPWFVSMDAWLYAFDLPRTSKLVAVSLMKNGKYRLEKFRITRYSDTVDAKKEVLKIEAWNGQGKPSYIHWKKRDKPISSSVNFCDNVSCFAFGPDTEPDCLGLEIPEKRIIRLHTSESPLKELEKRKTELLVSLWQAEKG